MLGPSPPLLLCPALSLRALGSGAPRIPDSALTAGASGAWLPWRRAVHYHSFPGRGCWLPACPWVMACQQSRYHSFSSASRLQPQPSGVTIDESFLIENKSTQKRKLLQKRRTLELPAASLSHCQAPVLRGAGKLLTQGAPPAGPRHRFHPGTKAAAHQREKIRALEPLKAKLVTVNEDCNERILAMRAEEKHEISLLKKEKMNLLKLIDKKNEEKISLQSEVAKLRKNLAEEYLHYLSERDARKILIADLNELQYQREDMSLAQSPGIWGEDPVKLTLALKMTRQDLTRTQMELNTMKANFGDVVPRRDFEMQEKTNKDLQEQLDTLRASYEEVRKEHEILMQLHMSTLKERDQFFSELQEIQRTSTPRPDWTKCEDVVAGGPERWQMLAEGKNSDQLVDVLLEEIGSGLLREKEFFPGLGYGEAIPAFLRFEGLVENKKPSKKDVVDLLKDAWKERLAEEQKETFPDFFFNFLERRFGPSDAMAWAYTIFENIKIFHSNEVMSQFYAVLMGKRSENVYVTQKETVAQLLKEMTNADSQNKGLLTMEQFNTVLKSTFPLKTEEQIQELMEAGGWHPSSSNADLLNYRSLFMEDEEGQSEPFVQKLWEQYMDEKDEYLQQLKQELGTELYEEVTLPKLRGALMTIDPSLNKQTVNTYMSQAFQLPESELPEDGDEKEEGVVEILQTALERLQVIDIRRVGPREPEPAN
ncbi:PREDICTED: translin-associated factor X-interacting protein 1 isoform X2 [Colobus angolensis palliatus]|nr:PREDICTED: translin-associated factor X-interacting protein 1 isoform X2 [Colobus angolensis palliatus]